MSKYLAQGFNQQAHITYHHDSEVINENIENVMDGQTSSDEDIPSQPILCKAQVHITEVCQSDGDNNDQVNIQPNVLNKYRDINGIYTL